MKTTLIHVKPIDSSLDSCGLPGRMGNNKQALQLIIQEENNVEKVSNQAIPSFFCKIPVALLLEPKVLVKMFVSLTMSDMSLMIDRPLNSPRNKMMKTCGMILSIILLTSQVF